MFNYLRMNTLPLKICESILCQEISSNPMIPIDRGEGGTPKKTRGDATLVKRTRRQK